MEILNEKRTHKCGELRAKDIGETVTLMGWVKRARDLGSLIFLQLRDISGVIQIVFDGTDTDKTLFEKASTLKMEYVIVVKGVVRRRTGDNVNPAMKTGEIEVVASGLKILAESETPPFVVGDTSAGEMLRLKYRYLDLRREDLQEILILRSRAASIVRNFLSERGFLEIETPFLGKSTPEGARDYLVPSRVHPGEFYALPQSPQLYKQLLMIAGFDRYYQIVKCFRDEDLRANRQMEFTQIDIEMSFVESQEDVLVIMEELICRLFKEVKGIKLDTPFKRMSFKEAMELYGCDKPDLRYGMKITNICDAVSGCGFSVFDNAVSGGGSVCAIKLDANESSLSRKDFDKYVEFAKSYKAKGLAWLALNKDGARGSFLKQINEEVLNKIIAKTEMHEGDALFIVADTNSEVVLTALGALRCELAERLGLIKKGVYEILWVTDFPLLEYSEEEERFVARHHPFTRAKDEDLHLLESNPAAVNAIAYDLVINGDEMGGGSLRIYTKEMQSRMFRALGFTDEQISERFGFFVDAFNYGAPPHGGIAFGLDRLIMTLAETNSIRDVIAFPKTQSATCMMTQAPSRVDGKQLKELHILTEDDKQPKN